MARVAINGLGRIGRAFLKLPLERPSRSGASASASLRQCAPRAEQTLARRRAASDRILHCSEWACRGRSALRWRSGIRESVCRQQTLFNMESSMETSWHGESRRHGGAARLRDNTARLLRICTLALGMYAALAALAHAQNVSTTRDARVTHREGKNMTELNTLDATVEAPAPDTLKVDTSIRPFRVRVSDEKITDLCRRIAATRWPTKELVKDRSQGVQLATLKELARYWTSEYDWR